MTAPSAASTVKAATVNAVAAMTLGTRASRPDEQRKYRQDQRPGSYQETQKQSWRATVLPGNRTGEHHGGTKYSAEGQDSISEDRICPATPRSP